MLDVQRGRGITKFGQWQTRKGEGGEENRTFCWMFFVNGPLSMSRCKPRPPPPPAHPRIGVNRGLVGVRIRKHSQEVKKFETIWNLLFPRYGDC